MLQKNISLFISIILLFSGLYVSNVYAIEGTASLITIESLPSSGDITTNINIKIRGEPYIISTTSSIYQPVLYIYYDNFLIVNRLHPFLSGTTTWLRWDITIKVPNQYPYSELGTHSIKAIVESYDGTVVQALSTFEIINYVPPPSFWDSLPSEFIEKIRGPQGFQGVQGIEGIQGIQGFEGIQGIQGDKGDQGIQGIQGVRGTDGINGTNGTNGKDAPTDILYIAIGIGVLSLIITIYDRTEIVKLRKKLEIKTQNNQTT